MSSFTILAVTAAVLALSSAYPYGVPLSACDSMVPGHGFDAQTENFDYTVVPSKTTVKPNEEIVVDIRATTDGYKGFLLEIRDKNDKAVGKFEVPEDDPDTQTANCHGGIATVASHKNAEIKHSLLLHWIAPEVKGEYTIYVTIVKEYEVYWVKEKAGTIKVE